MKNKPVSILEKSYYSVNVHTCDYFRETFIKLNKCSNKTFYNRLQKENPNLEDVLLFCHVCKVDVNTILKPLQTKFKNVLPYNSNLQMIIEP